MEHQSNLIQKIAPLFKDNKSTMVLSCLQNCMGTAISDNPKKPKSAAIKVGDFCCFGGIADQNIITHFTPENGFLLMVPPSSDWENLIEEAYPTNHQKIQRYSTEYSLDYFNQEYLKSLVNGLSSGFFIKKIDKTLYNSILKEEWSKDFCCLFSDYYDYQSHGFGFVCLNQKGEIVSGASSYSYYIGGIEIQATTRKDYRRMGLGAACAAQLILECLKHGVYPSWDAHNERSLSMAEKLGYKPASAYTTYMIFSEN